jgi:hypothetical protein
LFLLMKSRFPKVFHFVLLLSLMIVCFPFILDTLIPFGLL